MKKLFLGCLSSLAMSLIFSSAPAYSIGFTFRQDGFSEGAFLEGMFDGEDLDGDGSLSFRNAADNEFTEFTASFSGNSLVSAFSLGLLDLESLSLSPDPSVIDPILSFTEDDGTFLLLTEDSTFSFALAVFSDGIDSSGQVAGLPANDASLAPLVITPNTAIEAIPEPSTVIGSLLALSFAGALKRRQKIKADNA